ncbi:hypothetical protein HDU85_007164 [Gaertneriomyces sp. JEL0708]|nr:hypothetical protein HDU85_007164 [Gaertneriomyces sp. JEL0708]
METLLQQYLPSGLSYIALLQPLASVVLTLAVLVVLNPPTSIADTTADKNVPPPSPKGDSAPVAKAPKDLVGTLIANPKTFPYLITAVNIIFPLFSAAWVYHFLFNPPTFHRPTFAEIRESPSLVLDVLFAEVDPEMEWSKDRLIAFYTCLMGAALRYWAYQTLQAFFTFRISIQKDHRLITNGPYKMLRHPSYTGLLMIVPSYITFHALPAGIHIVTLISVILVVIRIKQEERMLEEAFGDEWTQYAKTRWRLLAGMY